MLMLRQPATSRLLLIRPGATEFDDQGRIKGSLDIPLSEGGRRQAKSIAASLAQIPLRTVYTSPCLSAVQTAELITENHSVRLKTVECFRNIDHGLWHGKLIEEVRRNQPRAYRLGQESPEAFCAPRGEPIHEAKARVFKTLRRIVKKGRDEIVALVIPDPLSTVVESMLTGGELDDLWKSETDDGDWRWVESTAF